MKNLFILLTSIMVAAGAQAQVRASSADSSKHKKSISFGSGGIVYTDGKAHKPHLVEVQAGMLDLGINTLHDYTDYSSAETQSFLRVDNSHKNADLFSLRNGKSINVNIYPVLLKLQLHKTDLQRWQVATGIGLQVYNFRFNKPVSYINNPTPGVIIDSVSFRKNKLALNYLMAPLMLNGKTRVAPGNQDTTGGKQAKEGTYITYGIGISGGYLLSSWTKQISDERGKDKNHDPFNLSKTNFCINGEIGIDGFIRLYASYQLTALHQTGLDQHPLCIGVRFLGL